VKEIQSEQREDEPAFPHTQVKCEEPFITHSVQGLTKREWFIGMALAGGNTAQDAIFRADITIKELNESKRRKE